jgi:hypothetical protein
MPHRKKHRPAMTHERSVFAGKSILQNYPTRIMLIDRVTSKAEQDVVEQCLPLAKTSGPAIYAASHKEFGVAG